MRPEVVVAAAVTAAIAATPVAIIAGELGYPMAMGVVAAGVAVGAWVVYRLLRVLTGWLP